MKSMGGAPSQMLLKFMARLGQQFIVRRAIYDKIKKAFAVNGTNFASTTATAPVSGGTQPTAAKSEIEKAGAG
jgi:hypothetical protein